MMSKTSASQRTSPSNDPSRVLLLTCVLSLTACGGSPAKMMTVSKVTVGATKYGQTLQFTVEGSLLDATLVAATTACSSPQRSASSTSTQATYTCTAALTGDSSFSVTDPKQSGVLGSTAFNVPLPQVTMTVSNGAGVAGNLVFTLEPNKVKATVDNFLQYVNDGFYAGTVFHRVVPGFVVQGGGYLPGSGIPNLKTPRANIALEVGRGLSNVVYSVAMARGASANSANSQFFVNLADNSANLDPSAANAGYAVFGVLSTGQDVLSAMTTAPCAPVAGFSECAPNPNVVITAASQSR